jgi:hypothetical protein
MVKRICGLLFACSLGLAAVVPAYAHHSASSEYDVNKTIQLTGVLTGFEWINPHAQMHLNVRDANGKVGNWDINFAGLSKLRLVGMGRETLVVGQTYKVIVNPAREGRHAGLINILYLPDGKVFRMGDNDTLRGGDNQ